MPRKRKNFSENRSSSPSSKEKPQARNAANARERARMRVLSRAFCRLKTTLPWVPADTKLSKLDTLRLASSYIAHLKGILSDEPFNNDLDPIHPAINMTWPFGFNRSVGGTGNEIEGDGDGEGGSEESWEEKDCVHLDLDDVNLTHLSANQNYPNIPHPHPHPHFQCENIMSIG